MNLFRGSLKKKDEDALMALVAKGDNKAFEELFDRFAGRLLGYAKKILGSQERAEEATQEIWTKVVRLAPSYNPQGHFKTWVMTMIRNHCLNIIRKDKRLSFQEDVGEVLDQQEQFDVESQIMAQFSLESVSLALNQLPEKQRVALTILYTEEPSYEDLAKEMNLSLGALKSTIHRGRKALYSLLSEEVL